MNKQHLVTNILESANKMRSKYEEAIRKLNELKWRKLPFHDITACIKLL